MTDADTQPTDVDVPDDRPLAVRRKRRLASSMPDGDAASDPQLASTVSTAATTFTKTPTKAKKKVRFTDPGPAISNMASSSTGLTPALKRTNVALGSDMPPPKTPRLLNQDPRRRRSLPLDLSNTLPSPSLTPPATPLSGEVQFAPFREVLDERLKRRLRRNNMSEEQNDIDADNRKSKGTLRQEMRELRDELAATKELQQGTKDIVKGEDDSHEKIQELEHEIQLLRQEMRERSMTVEHMITSEEATIPATSAPAIYNDDHEDDFVMVDVHQEEVAEEPRAPLVEREVLRDTTHLHMTSSSTDAASQTSGQSSNAENERFREARLTLERLFPGEIALGLTNDPRPLLNTMLQRLQLLKTQLLISNDSLALSRTSETNMRSQFNAMLGQLSRARTHAEEIATELASQKERADVSQNAAKPLRRDLEKATRDITSMGADINEKERSIQKLQDALESYRSEVSRLEMLITNMESDHKAAIAKLKGNRDETVADLECRVAAETLGRRAAEGESVERGERIKQLRHLEQELRNAMNEKQGVIRDLEKELARVGEMKEQEVGGLNVEIGKMASNLNDVKVEMNKLKAENKTLHFRVEEEKAAGLKAVEDIQAEMARCVDKTEDVKTHHLEDMYSRGSEVNEHKGLLTPVTGGRFKDVEGYVEVHRGKVRRGKSDGGIDVVVEEVEGEDELMLDSDI